MSSDSIFRDRLVRTQIYYGWFVVVACFLAATTTFGVIYSFNVFISPLAAEYGKSTSTVSLVFSLHSIVAFGFSMVFGFFVDRYGARRLLVTAGGLIGGGLLLVNQVDSFLAVALLYGTVVSIGLGIGYVVSYATVPRWFDRRRGIATSIAVSGSGFGIIIGPIVANVLVSRVGWQDAYLSMGLLAVTILLVAAALLAESPSKLGVDVSAEFPNGNDSTANAGRDLRTQLADVSTAIRRPGLIFILLGFLFLYVPVYVVLVHIVSHLTDVGVSRDIAVLVASLIGAMNIAGKYIFGPITDRVGEIPTIVAGCLLVSIGTLGYVFTTSVAGVILATVIFGLGYGGSAVLISPIVARFFGEADINTLTGVVSTGFAVSGSLGPFLAGAGFDHFGSYTLPLIGGSVIGIMAATLFITARRTSETVSTATDPKTPQH